jgi:hypothetical protein
VKHRAPRNLRHLPVGRLTVGQVCVIAGYPVPNVLRLRGLSK